MLIFSFLDIPRENQINFQDPATAIMEGIIELHHIIFFFLIIIITLVFWMFFRILLHYSYQFNYIFNKKYFKIISENMHHRKTFKFWLSFVLYTVKKNLITQKINHNSTIEIIWVILPAIVLIFIALPSFTLLYSMDEIFDPTIVIKVIGHQWYWSYEFAETTIFEFPGNSKDSFHYIEYLNEYINEVGETVIQFKQYGEFAIEIHPEDANKSSYLIQTDFLTLGLFRLLETDTTLFLPLKTQLQLLITSDDVLHSWAVPSLGVKIDAVPGRLNQINIFLKRAGVFYGQCSEICGINHGFMPIKIVSLDTLEFWLTFANKKFIELYNNSFIVDNETMERLNSLSKIRHISEYEQENTIINNTQEITKENTIINNTQEIAQENTIINNTQEIAQENTIINNTQEIIQENTITNNTQEITKEMAIANVNNMIEIAKNCPKNCPQNCNIQENTIINANNNSNNIKLELKNDNGTESVNSIETHKEKLVK